MARLQIESNHGAARRKILDGLVAFNEDAVGPHNDSKLTITLRSRNKIVGGLAGEIFFGWLYISLLWVSDGHRGHGFGSKMMKAAETEARRRGARHAWVDSFTFQAPAFYRKLGYRVFGRLKDFPAGHSRVFLVKAL